MKLNVKISENKAYIEYYEVPLSKTLWSPPSPKCYMALWDMIRYSDALHWSDSSLNLDLVTERDLIAVFDVITLF